MKNKFNIITLLLLLMATMAVAQQIKFPESFKADTSLFSGMKIAEIPEQFKNKYNVNTNPGVTYQPAQVKGLFRSADFNAVEAIYFEVWNKGSINSGFEIAKFKDTTSLKENAQIRRSRRDEAYLSAANYLIIVHGDRDDLVDILINYFKQKLGAKLILDKLRVKETAVTEKYVSNLPPPLPPGPKGNVTKLAIGDIDKRIANTDGLAYMRTKNRKKLAPGNYLATAMQPFETLSFTIDKDSLLHGDYLYHYAEDYSKSPSRESKLTYDHGVLISKELFSDGQFKGSTTNTVSVIKDGNDFLITQNTVIKNPAYGDKEIKTVFRNRKPISKITTRLGVLLIKKDFEKNILERYNNKGQLIRQEKPGLTEEYDATGKVIYKDAWVNDSRTVVKNGKLSRKETRVKDKEQYLVTLYDEHGKVTKEWLEGAYEKHAVIADPDEYENSLSKALFEYYKKKIAQ